MSLNGIPNFTQTIYITLHCLLWFPAVLATPLFPVWITGKLHLFGYIYCFVRLGIMHLVNMLFCYSYWLYCWCW